MSSFMCYLIAMLTDIINLGALIYHANNSSTIMEECQTNFKENVDAS